MNRNVFTILADSEMLFIIEKIITDGCLDKQRQSLSELDISVMQCYSAIPRNLKRQSKAILVSYLREKIDNNMIHDKNGVLM